MLSCINQQGKNPFLLSTLVIQRNLLLHHFNKDRCFYVQLSHNYIVIKVVCIMNVMVKNKIYGKILIWKEVIRSWILISCHKNYPNIFNDIWNVVINIDFRGQMVLCNGECPCTGTGNLRPCPRIMLPVCGQNGQTYDNQCLLEQA